MWPALPVSQPGPAVLALSPLGGFFLGEASVSVDF